ncbi:helix-turn-helix domain-containing protein [Paenibacillus sp. EKM202P]|nr:helix-turn-helix domain-containing protein [Paenibacillus sp. EKM202P]KAF6559336.1 helix-turn-helix domain-containing protein [Paenibacillus sp. EKM207P]
MEAVRLVNEEHMSIREVTKQLDIRNKSQVQSWVMKYRAGENLQPTTTRQGRPKTKFSICCRSTGSIPILVICG